MRAGIATQNNVFKAYDVDTGEALDGTVTIELPSNELASNEYKGAGVGGAINVPAPGVMNAQQITMSLSSIYGPLADYLAVGTTRSIDLRNEVMVTNKDTHANEKVANRWVLKGPISQANPGKVEQAATSDGTIIMQCYYMHHWLDGDDVLEWDPFKGIHTVNGVDLMADTRKNVFVG